MQVKFLEQSVTGPLPVALVNTTVLSNGARVDMLDSWAAVLAWYACWSGRTATAFEAPDPGVAAQALGELRRLRDECRAALEANAKGTATTRALESLNRLLDAHLTVRTTLAAANGGIVSARSSSGPNGPALLLSEICLAIVELFASARAARVKQCAHDECILFFLDESKSGTRTWCDMKTCGNRMKAARYYERTKR